MGPMTLVGFAHGDRVHRRGKSDIEARHRRVGRRAGSLWLLGWKLGRGLALFGCGGVVYALLCAGCRSILLRCSRQRSLSESVALISPARWLGSAHIVFGILLVV